MPPFRRRSIGVLKESENSATVAGSQTLLLRIPYDFPKVFPKVFPYEKMKEKNERKGKDFIRIL